MNTPENQLIDIEIDELENVDTGAGNGNGEDPLIARLIKVITDKLLEYEADGRPKFRRRILTLFIPGSEGFDMWTDGYDRASTLTADIEGRQRYAPIASEAVFETIFADCLTRWYWTRKSETDGVLRPSVAKFIRSRVETFVSGIGEERKPKSPLAKQP